MKTLGALWEGGLYHLLLLPSFLMLLMCDQAGWIGTLFFCAGILLMVWVHVTITIRQRQDQRQREKHAEKYL